MRQKGETFRKVLSSDCLMFLVIFGLILICGTATAASPEEPLAAPTTDELLPLPPIEILYELAPGSELFQGCTGPCMCPVQEVGQLEGTFDLGPVNPTPNPTSTPLLTRYALTNIQWMVKSSGRVIHKITGNGVYEIAEATQMQEMTLFLSIDGKQTITLDSGLVPLESPFPPDISIKVDLGKKCYDLWMNIDAIPQNEYPPPCAKNGDCSPSEFCLFPEGQCSGSGVCTPKPDVCPMYCLPLCGCDMKTYCNQCEAYGNGVSILHDGQCQ